MRTLLAILAALLLMGCGDLDVTRGYFACDSDEDCVEGYRCDRIDNQEVCVERDFCQSYEDTGCPFGRCIPIDAQTWRCVRPGAAAPGDACEVGDCVEGSYCAGEACAVVDCDPEAPECASGQRCEAIVVDGVEQPRMGSCTP